MRRISLAATTAFILGVLPILLPPASAQQNRTVAILMPGAGGIHPNDFLIRNRGKIDGAGIETRVTTSPSEAVEIARAERQKGRKVVLVGMSLGTVHVGQALAAGASVNGAVLVSGFLRGVASDVGAPGKLPPTLIVHHRNDACAKTPPEGVGYFQKWAAGRARVAWIATTGGPDNQPCRPNGAHGFFRKDGGPVSAIVSFIRSR